MPSLFAGYEYDVFISYRHNDNRSGWLTEFVRNLNLELAATVKESVSVYFDSNLHDGLSDTHDVQDSLATKLKCVIFIPILSQTYCDPRSFAWNNEFLVFKRNAGEEPAGIKVKLGNGNVASRILPIKINDLDGDDRTLLEKQIGPIRSIDFIYRTPGINRPLHVHDEVSPQTLSSVHYRDQINKVANAIKELLFSFQEKAEKITAKGQHSKVASTTDKLIGIGAGLLFAIGFAIYFFFFFKKA